MKILIVFALLIFTVSCAKVDPLNGLSKERAFQNLIKTYNKVYDTHAEYKHRFSIFNANLKIIDDLNAKDPEAIYGITEFADLSPQEFSDLYLIKNYSLLKTELENNGLVDLLPTAPELTQKFNALPTSFDWNGKGCVTAIYQQGQCGSCWAFASAENLETAACIAGKGLRNFSMQQLLDCVSNGGCQGGYPSTTLGYAVTSGIMAYAGYSYTGVKGTCKYNSASVVQRFTGWGYVDKNRNEPNIQNWVLSTGAPAVLVDAKTWQYYQGGVITTNCGTAIDHVVQITGWTNMNGRAVWKVRNSWGSGWGSSGYIYIAIGQNLCAIAQEVLSAY